MTASGCGALIGALWLATRKSVLGLGRIISIASASFGAGLIAFSFSRVLWLSLIFLIVRRLRLDGADGLEQHRDSDDRRRREARARDELLHDVLSWGRRRSAACWRGAVGADRRAAHGAPERHLLLAAAAWFRQELPGIRSVVRPIYVRMGILPEVASGLQSAAQLMTPPEQE